MTQLCPGMREVFINCQSGHHGQATLIKTLTKLHEVEDSEKFFADFIYHVRYFLIVFKRDNAVERAIDLIAKFSTSLQALSCEKRNSATETKESVEHQLDCSVQEDLNPFLLKLFNFLLENHKARDKAVRFRVCQLINRLFTCLGDDAAIDDDLYGKVYTSMQCRLRDKFPIVRVHAVLALARLQDPNDPDCPVVAAFRYMLEYDVNADVRRAVLSSIAATTRTVGVILDRTRDSKDAVRRLSYQIIAEKVHVRALTIAQRVRILRQGLNDRNESVREACATYLVKAWLNTYSGDKLHLLGLLDVENSMDIAQHLLSVLFKNLSVDELTSDLEILDDERVVRIERLTCESALYWRCLCEHMRSLGASIDESIDKVIPSGVAYAKFLRRIMERASNEIRVDEQLENEFILQQLVHLIAVLDLSDEVNRKHIIQVLHDLLLSECVTHSIASSVLNRYSHLHKDSDAFVASIAEVIADIREPITVQQQSFGRDESRQLELKLAAVRVQLNQVRDDLDDCVQKQDFKRAAELKQQIAELDVQRQTLLNESQPKSSEVRTEKTDPQTLLKCLSLLSELLTEARFKKLTPSLQTLIEVLILPGIQNADPAVRNLAVKALGLCCLRSVDLARERVVLLLQVSRMDQETVKLTALRAIFDLVHFFGLEVFKIGPTVDKTDDADSYDGLTSEKKDNCDADFDDLTSDNSSDPGKTNFGVDIVTILTDLLDSNSSEVRTLCAEGFAKLLIAGRIVSPTLLSRLLLLWYNPITEDDTRLRHCIGTFLPVYAFGSRQNQELTADAILPTLQTLFDAPGTSPLAEVKVANVAELLVELTDIRRQMADRKSKDNIVDKSPHDDVAVKIANQILSNPNSLDARILVKTLCSLHVTPTNQSALKDLRVLSRRMLKEVKDKQCTRPLEKFARSIRDMLQQLKTDAMTPGGKSSHADSEDDLDYSKQQQNDDVNASSSVLEAKLNGAMIKKDAKVQKFPHKAMKKLMSHSRLSPQASDEECSVSDFDTENDDIFVSPKLRPPVRASAANATLLTLKALESSEAQISEGSDFETSSGPVATAKMNPRTRSTASKRRRSPLSDQSN